MNTGCIYNIDITTNSNNVISIPSDFFDHFYIANIDDSGNEINYESNSNNNNLYANFFMIRILNEDNYALESITKKLYDRNDIVKIEVFFTNGSTQAFSLPKKRIVHNKKMINSYEETFYDDKNLCIVVTDKKVMYKNNLFA